MTLDNWVGDTGTIDVNEIQRAALTFAVVLLLSALREQSRPSHRDEISSLREPRDTLGENATKERKTHGETESIHREPSLRSIFCITGQSRVFLMRQSRRAAFGFLHHGLETQLKLR